MPTLIPVVPAKDRRKLHHGDRGNDVKAYGRLLHRTLKHMGLVSVNAQNGVFGDGLLKDTLLLQKHLGFFHPTGVVDLTTWQAVDPQMHAYERLLLKLPTPPPATHGTKTAAFMRSLLILQMPYYSQRRPAARTVASWDKIGSDCSASVLLADALGVSYGGYGNSQTIWDEWDHVDEKNLQIGDAAVYGPGYKTTHVAELSNVKLMLVIGFGSAPGSERPAHYRGDLMGWRRRP